MTDPLHTPTGDAELDEDGERPVLRFERRFAQPPERVWRAITEPDELKDWFPVEAGPLERTTEEPPRLLGGEWVVARLARDLRAALRRRS